MEDQNTELKRVKEELESFIYVASHDLKTPLRAISAMAQFVREDYEDKLDQEALDSLDEIFTRSMRMNKLIEAMLEYHKIGNGNTKVEEINSIDLIKDAIAALNIPENIKIEIADEEKFPKIHFNDISFDQVVTNIIKNAVQHAGIEEGGSIQISYHDAGDFHQFIIQDNGKGIDPEHHERIFLIFQSLDAKDKVKNVGMGLTIANKIIQSNGGTIELNSTPGEGSSFKFTIPKFKIET